MQCQVFTISTLHQVETSSSISSTHLADFTRLTPDQIEIAELVFDDKFPADTRHNGAPQTDSDYTALQSNSGTQ